MQSLISRVSKQSFGSAIIRNPQNLFQPSISNYVKKFESQIDDENQKMVDKYVKWRIKDQKLNKWKYTKSSKTIAYKSSTFVPQWRRYRCKYDTVPKDFFR